MSDLYGIRVLTDESLLPDEGYLIADPEEFVDWFCGEVERELAYYRLMRLVGSVESLRREALGEMCPNVYLTAIKRWVNEQEAEHG